MVGLITTAVLVSLTGASPVLAANDPYGVITDADGTRWVTMSMPEFLALPAVASMETAMLATAAGDFRAGYDTATDEEPRPLWSVVQQGKVTRVLERRGSVRTIRYIGPGRECRRSAPRGTSSSIASDAAADFVCRDRRPTTWDGEDYVRGFLPSALGGSSLPPDPRVVVREADLSPPPGAEQSMSVVVREASLLGSLGLYGGPGLYAYYEVTGSGISTELDESNGISWLLQEFALSSRGVPSLPRGIARQVR